jgi:hypothetical protein
VTDLSRSGVGVEPQPTEALWLAVDSLTKPTTRRINRERLAEWLETLATGPDASPRELAAYRAATVTHGVIPSLWAQAEAALTTGSETVEGQPSPLASRSPADLDLMDTMLTIRESLAWQLPGRGIKPKPGVPAQMRQLAAHVAGHEPQHVDWWTYRFAQWARVLGVYLQAIETGPKPVRLRGLPCPKCRARTVIDEKDQGPVVAPAIVVDFINGYIRAAQCKACAHTWWRGDSLWDLAREAADLMPEKPSDADGTLIA